MTVKRLLLAAAVLGTGYAVVRVASWYAPEGVRRAAGDFATTVRNVSAEREAQLREALGLAIETDALGADDDGLTPEVRAALLDDPTGRAL
jgi:hypothetical protein